MLKALHKELSLHAYKEVHITVASRKHKHGVLGEQQFRNNILHFLQNWYPTTLAHFTAQPMAANVLLEIADFVSNSLYRQYAGENMSLLEPLKGKTITMKNPL